MNKYGVDLSVISNQMPTPYEMILEHEFLQLTFLGNHYSSFPWPPVRQIHDLVSDKVARVHFVDYTHGYVAIASIRAYKDWNAPPGWRALETKYGFTTFVAFYHVGCKHEGMTDVRGREFEHTYSCAECGFSETLDSS